MASNTQFVYTAFTNRKDERIQMVERQLRARGIHDPRVLQAMLEVPRHAFVPQAEAGSAYEDGPLAIGFGQTISQPYIVARVAELLQLSAYEKVLEIGAGCGYQAAILGKLCATVVGIEKHAELALRAREHLRAIGITNVTILEGDGRLGNPASAPFDAIVVSCALHEQLPPAWHAQLREGGILVVPIEEGQGQELYRYRKVASGWTREKIFSVRYVPLL